MSPYVHHLTWFCITEKSRGTGPCPVPAGGQQISISRAQPGEYFTHQLHSSSRSTLGEPKWLKASSVGPHGQAGRGQSRSLTSHSTAVPLAVPGWAPGPRVGDSGMEAEAGEGRAGIQRQCLSKSHSPSQLCSAARCFLVNIYRDYVSLLRASKRACAIILRTDWECKPNIFFSSLSKSDDQLWLQSCQILSNIAQNYTEP